ncbi:MAG: hypothetical protein JWQ16_949 [Novosphingobium sp.]|nr:hypothetical protein [Novosphingobium sp.]
MTKVEVYDKNDDTPLFEGAFDFLPRVGESISKEAHGYFNYHDIVDIWHREMPETGQFHACVRVRLDVDGLVSNRPIAGHR